MEDGAPEESFWKSKLLLHITFILIFFLLGLMFGYLWGSKEGFHAGCEITESIYKAYGK